MRQTRTGVVILVVGFVILCLPSRLWAMHTTGKNADVLTFAPADDGGRFITLHDSQNLQQWRFNVGVYFDYAYEPIEFADQTGTRRQGIIDDLVMANVHGAFGLFDWWSVGFNVPVDGWQTFYNPDALSTVVQKQTFFGKLGDPRVDMKFRLLDIDRYHVGLAVVPFLYMPLGKEEYYLGNGMWSAGGTLVIDFDIANRVFLTINGGYRDYRNFRYDPNSADATLDDTIQAGGGINVRLTDSWAILGEGWHEGVRTAYFANSLQNPAEFVAGGRWTPQQHVRGLAVTAGGGRGITTGIGSPDWRAFVGVNYRRPAVVELPPPPPPAEVEVRVEEKIVITQKIHFEFDKAVIRQISYPILDDVASLLNINPQIRLVRVEGHTDEIGSDKYNQKLSEKRANAVRDYLIGKGIEPDRLQAAGFGESRPIADNHSTRGRARNRRTEFNVVQ